MASIKLVLFFILSFILFTSRQTTAYIFDPLLTSFSIETISETQVISAFFTDTVTVGPTATTVVTQTEWLVADWAATSATVAGGSDISGGIAVGDHLVAPISRLAATPSIVVSTVFVTTFVTVTTDSDVYPTSDSGCTLGGNSTGYPGGNSSSTVATRLFGNMSRASTFHAPITAPVFTNTSSVMSTTTANPPFTNYSSVASATTAMPSLCGEYGNFTLGWDDEPSFTPSNASDAPFPPIFNPYHHLYYSNGYVYAPPPKEVFLPVSPPKLAIFWPNDTQDIGSPYASLFRTGEISAGPLASDSAFWFNAYGAYLGCSHEGLADCNVEVTGYTWHAWNETEVLAAQANFTLTPCSASANCTLSYVDFTEYDTGFVSLSGIKFNVTVNDEVQALYMDNLEMSWFNNTCEAGLERQMSRKK